MSQFACNILLSGSLVGFVAVTFSLYYRLNGFFHLGHGAFVTVGAYAAYVTSLSSLRHPAVAIAVSFFVAGGIALVLEACVFLPLRRRAASELNLFVASLGILVVMESAISLCCGADTKVLSRGWWTEPMIMGEARISYIQVAAIAGNLLLLMLVAMLMYLAPFGRSYRAVCADHHLARSIGIAVTRLRLAVAAGAAGFAGVGGALWAYDQDLTPALGFRAILLGAVAAVIGGKSPVGAFVAAMIIAAMQHVLALAWAVKWQDMSVFILLLVFLLLRPQGYLGRHLRAATG